jgi:hypothetical protein
MVKARVLGQEFAVDLISGVSWTRKSRLFVRVKTQNLLFRAVPTVKPAPKWNMANVQLQTCAATQVR